MKKILFLIALTGFFVNAQGQGLKSTDVPVSVMDSFNINYPEMQDVEWNQDGINYSAGFEENQLGRTITYAASGKLVGVDEQIVLSAVPNSVTAYVLKNYEGNEMDSASKVTGADGTVTYKTKMEGKDLFFDSRGNFMKSVEN